MKIPTFYNQSYFAQTPTASMRKLPLIAGDIERKGYATLIDPYTSVSPKDVIGGLMRLHDPMYVKHFIDGEKPLCNSQGWKWTKEIRNGVMAINAGMLAGARQALDTGIAANIGQGFHHAGFYSGSGYCTFNGLALVANHFPKRRIMVLDCDEHQGNGTMEFVDMLPNLYNFTIFGSHFGGSMETDEGRSRNIEVEFTKPVTDRFEEYLMALYSAFGEARDNWKPDLIIYQAGADPHINDPLGSLGITTKQMQTRDRLVFEFVRDFKIPCLFVMAGGYQHPVDNTVKLHVNTFEAASRVFDNPAAPEDWEWATV